eukprot:XP_019926148.1 PREDICTED: uncharacterized protein LOC109619741 [Crassostrea gigas]
MTDSENEIQITETEIPQEGNDCLLKIVSSFEIIYSLVKYDFVVVSHISCVASDQVWVSDDDSNFILTNTTGDVLHRVEDSCSGLYGLHTVNSEGELIYIDENYNINKMSKDLKTTTTFIETTDSRWEPRCVYWSPSTGDLLVGMSNRNYRETGNVSRYNQSGQLLQSIQHDNTGLGLYSRPRYITENTNGDVVVSDHDDYSLPGAVVVTERGGRHRFSYTGHPSGSGLKPRGICTDALSHILVCDHVKVHMLNKDGQFLTYLLTDSRDFGGPCSLRYDVFTEHLWVGSHSDKVAVYKYKDDPEVSTDKQARQIDEATCMFSSGPAME